MRERQPQRVAGDRITAHPHQELELRLRHPITHRELAFPEGGDTRPEPLARWCSRLDVVPGERVVRARSPSAAATVPSRYL